MTTNFKIIVACLTLCFNTTHLYADKYVILHISRQGNIYIRNERAKVGTTFDDKKDTIRWTSEKQSFRARLLPKGKSVDDKVFSASKAKTHYISLWEYLRGLNVKLGIKGTQEERLDTLLLLDSLTIGSLKARVGTQFEARWKVSAHEYNKSKLTASTNKDEVYIVRELFGNTAPQTIELEIWATDELGKYKIRTILVGILEP